jgi:hypothetical protein
MTKRMLGEVVHDLISSRTDKILRVTHLRELEWFEPRRYFDEDEFEFLLRSRAGGIYHSHLELSEDSSTASFIFISPNDDWPYICFITSHPLPYHSSNLTTYLSVILRLANYKRPHRVQVSSSLSCCRDTNHYHGTCVLGVPHQREQRRKFGPCWYYSNAET